MLQQQLEESSWRGTLGVKLPLRSGHGGQPSGSCAYLLVAVERFAPTQHQIKKQAGSASLACVFFIPPKILDRLPAFFVTNSAISSTRLEKGSRDVFTFPNRPFPPEEVRSSLYPSPPCLLAPATICPVQGFRYYIQDDVLI